MNELLSLLNAKERRAASVIGVVCAAALLLALVVSVKAGAGARRAASELAAAEKNYRALSLTRSESRKEWQAWQDAEKDLTEVREKYFYPEKKVLEDMRLDLEQIFNTVGISVTDITYGYTEVSKGSIRKETADFHFVGNYMILKRLLDLIERHPRLIHVERIDFISIGRSPGALDLKITIAGYYEN